jgi:hypothetical protein
MTASPLGYQLKIRVNGPTAEDRSPVFLQIGRDVVDHAPDPLRTG